MKFPNLHIIWTAGRNLALRDTLSRNSPPELLTRKTTEKIPQNIIFYLAKDETLPQLDCKCAVKTDINHSQTNNLQHFPLYLDCKNNRYEVDLLGISIFKPIPYSHWIKNIKLNKNEWNMDSRKRWTWTNKGSISFYRKRLDGYQN